MPDTLHLVCPHCQAVNRVPGDRLAAGPKCGKCHGALLEPNPLPMGGAAFAKLIGRGDLPVLVDFWAPWCGPCKMMAPAFEQAARQLHPRVMLAKVNTEDERGLAAQFGIQSIPTMVLFKGGREFDRVSGAMPAPGIVDWVRSRL